MRKPLLIAISLSLAMLSLSVSSSCGLAAEFEVMTLDIEPAEMVLGETATVTADITNSGGIAGTYTAILNVNGKAVASQEVTIPTGGSQTVTFSLSEDTAGSYLVSVGGMSATLVVKDKPAVKEVPSEYSQMYATLKSILERFDTFLESKNTDAKYPVIFGAELLPANGNRGADLLRPQVIQGVSLTLDRLQELGVQGVTIAIGYPLYTPDFPGYQEYVKFFKQVAQEVRRRGMKLDVESAVVFANTDFSSITTSFAGLTFEQFKIAKAQMVASIIKDLAPDYLNLGAEPDTMASLTGLKEFNDPVKYTEYVNYVLQNVNRGNTKIIAGIGTWGNLSYVRNLAASTSLDCLAIHIYPVVGDCLSKAVEIAEIAAQYKKGLVLDECWLYKVDKLPTSGVAAAPEIFRRDSFSFWEPLDQQFLAEMVKFAQLYRVEYISPFWTTFFFGNLDYSPENASLPYTEITAQVNQVASQNLLSDKFTATGEFYRKLIR